mgnify:CR=1 FL=1
MLSSLIEIDFLFEKEIRFVSNQLDLSNLS